MEDRRHIFNRPITLLGFMISAKNQKPLSRSGPKDDSRKSRDIQSLSQRRCEFKSADSRAVTKRGLFDCEPAHTADRMVQCDKTTCAQWAKEAKCNIQICFHLWQSVNENKCVACIDETDISFDCRKCLYQQRRIPNELPF